MNTFLRISVLFLFLIYGNAHGQAPVQSIARQEIDAKRMDSNPLSSDALPRSREFIRIDKTYYVGWMYEGIYKQRHAADFLGFKNAIAPLQKSLNLLEKDYAVQLSTRTSDFMKYYPAFRYQLDYTMIANLLADCYANIQQPEEAFQIAEKVKKWNFQRDFYFNPYIQMAWLTHRNRFYKSTDYAFLKNSIPENELMAHAYLDSAQLKINKDKILNREVFQPGYEKNDLESVYHYRAILYSYALNVDSANKYYRLLMESSIPSYNNFGTYLSISGKFREAKTMYEQASEQDMGDKRLQEWAYYSSILAIYQGKPGLAVESMTDMIKAVGSTPGFGWYNIALARAENYEGQIMHSERHLNKAESFKEVHIGTTLGQTHYDFSINMVKLMNQINRIAAIKFENKGWWYHPSDLFQYIRLTTEKYLLEYLIVNQLASNPEREKVVYTLFSTESTVSWDEIWFLIRDFSTSFFYREFEKMAETDQRPLIHKYFQLYIARLDMKKGNYEKAQENLKSIISNPNIDRDYEKLFLARCFEALSICAKKNNDIDLKTTAGQQFYRLYPQLVPYSDISMNFRLEVGGNVDKKLINQVKQFNIHWNSSASISEPAVSLTFRNINNKKSVIYSVFAKNGEEIIAQKEFFYKDSKAGGKELVYRLFNIDNTI